MKNIQHSIMGTSYLGLHLLQLHKCSEINSNLKIYRGDIPVTKHTMSAAGYEWIWPFGRKSSSNLCSKQKDV